MADRQYRQMVEADFAARAEILEAADIDLDAMGLSRQERQAMEFLYAYMPLGDIVNKPAEYYLSNYRMSVNAQESMDWGTSVPEREFRHFVLPVRVNNESLDDARSVFQEELFPRVQGLSMYGAVLEVNHWCHEKAIYTPSDRRTSSPLATIKTAYGRCGEESTLLVAALRSVGIPARQVYTPRWAHTDSNHAWVEAWVDGQWHFLGACEPEPVLDLGWFNAPASRGMLMHTKVFGRYDGPEEVVGVTPNHTEINVIENYAPASAVVSVKVLDQQDKPVESATVEFKVYNYSCFETVATKDTDSKGTTYLTAGLGDMLIHASKAGSFGFKKVSFGKDKEVVIKLNSREGAEIERQEMDVYPPDENVKLPKVTEEQAACNAARLEYEDSLRNSYVATFYDMNEASAFAGSAGLPSGTAEVLVAARGNHEQIQAFIMEAVAKGRGDEALKLLKSIAEKDLRDTPKSVLDDHLYNSAVGADVAKILCPRVETELLTPYRAYLQSKVPQALADSIRKDPAVLVDWCRKNLSMHDDINLRYVQLAPERVWDTRLADKWSRDIFFVAMCRSLGVPSWIDTVTGALKYDHEGLTYDVDFEASAQKVSPQGYLKLNYKEIALLDDPKYKSHFTLSRFEDGSFKLQNFTGSWSELFRNPCKLDCGYYMLTSGARMSGGNVCADVVFFTVEEGRTTTVELVIRDDSEQLRVIGNFDSEGRYLKMPSASSDISEGVEGSVLSTSGRGYFAIVLADYGTEPTNHAFKDISAVAAQLEEWGRQIIVIFATEDDYRKFRSEDFNLPSTVSYGIDVTGAIRKNISTEMKLSEGGSLPLIVLADTFNRVVFFSQGYTIGLGERIVKVSKVL